MLKKYQQIIVIFLLVLNICGSIFFIYYNNKDIENLNEEVIRRDEELDKIQLQLNLQKKINTLQMRLNEEITQRLVRR